ncbi:MAG: Isomerizing Glutamine-fructose-6-phosphate aminotransferase [candidate division TM6 bacterium GW2011_GWE2_36_25]|nr:MAG: Isomerizing Glutamine-fructose-6-phosphate aminotransferase [candidate division TM6 bacterium GW2011_GWF2_36_131]KKQ02949.1 MAG: Isomerizing Glutamine-fructose-6-phosphate aminotransferase [candidate division TM6 bacterium GW2011_GWE2_36_25]KKQ19682.1 MAG: Isomerizing Glutamine-fructose-6-phosphate aminotransferase [candidate division TM6 bacterium GW2011_GWA2_36_9]
MNRKIFITPFLFFIVSVKACSIVGYIGDCLCKSLILKQLSRLEYRGYDSAGFACLNPKNNRLVCLKRTGKLQNLINALDRDPIDAHIAIGHTRWATHGVASEENAHPHVDGLQSVALAHNGIIENHFSLRNQLKKEGCIFQSETDTEVIAHLLGKILNKTDDLKAGLMSLTTQLEGAFAVVAISQKFADTLIAIRKDSPLCIGINEHEKYIASDVLAFSDYTDKVIYLPNKSFALAKKNSVEIYDFDGKLLDVKVQPILAKHLSCDKDGQPHFMLKEIYEQKSAIKATVNFYRSLKDNLDGYINVPRAFLRELKKIHIIACGTSWHAGRIGQYFLESIARVPTHVHLASEYRYESFIPEFDVLYVLISQSGETADTLAVLRELNQYNLNTLTITNVASSSMARESKGYLQTIAGPEVAVASTKAFTTQMTALYWLAHIIGLQKGLVNDQQMTQAEDDLIAAGSLLIEAIKNNEKAIVESVAKKYIKYQRFFFLGRHIGYPFALEGALKLKEISYLFAMGYPAGELKHGSIALIDEQTPTVLFSHMNPIIYQKIISNAQEIKARNGNIIAFAFEGQDELIKLADQAFIIPSVKPLLEPFVMSGVMQFFAYQIAKQLGRDIDQPRNLAKSVTVE